MLTSKDQALAQLRNGLTLWDKYSEKAGYPLDVESQLITTFVDLITRLAPMSSAFRRELSAAQARSKTGIPHDDERYTRRQLVPVLAGIVLALKDAYETGYDQEVEQLVHAESFNNYLDMATHLLEEGYKDPAAVIIGSTLEEHLRQLCKKGNVSLELSSGKAKSAETMNTDLRAAEVYQVLDQKNITAWLDLRNKAAHGKYLQYETKQVELMLQAVRDFIARVPA